ncbi:thiamine pyrophosphate-binding protein [Candidatus Obscuribacterales bacterium]|nr:thiamine pyrophosphate-binding protein [Candidatus Obscuribacterales bacterium]MBX3153907.1 thiamine pyrophosphate-binding protein [Candidatus Obscuribacterales bacterium]
MTTAQSRKSLTVHQVLDQLRVEGVRYLFGSVSSSDSPISASVMALRGKEGENIHFLGSVHEASAVFMASGYAQATSLPGVVNIASGHLLNAVPAIYAANRSQIPLVILADQEDSHIINDEPPLTVEHHLTVRTIAKWMAEARTAREIGRLMRRAFHEALSPPKGPVVLSIPINLLLSTAKSQVIRPPLTSPLGTADQNFVSKVVGHLVRAENPAIIAGNEVSQYRARRDTVLMSEVLGCPVYCEAAPIGVNFPNRHPHFAGVLPQDVDAAHERLKAHDLILALGVQNRLPNRSEGPSMVPDTGTIIQINMDGRLAGMTFRSTMATQADISETLSRIRAEMQLAVDNDWLSKSKVRTRNTITGIAEVRHHQEESLLYPNPAKPTSLFWLMRLLEGIRPPKSVVVSDIIHANAMPFEILSLESGSSFFSSNSGVNGFASGAACGVQFAGLDIPIICLTGDESFLGYPQTLWTARHYGLNTKFVIANTQSRARLNMLPSAPTRRPPRFELTRPEISLTRLAASMDVPAFQVQQFSDLEPALVKLFSEPGPALIDVLIDPESYLGS